MKHDTYNEYYKSSIGEEYDEVAPVEKTLNNNRVTKSTENLRDKSHNESTNYESSAMKTP